MMDPADVPDYVPLWSRTHVARTPKTCSLCKEPIEVGQKYEDIGYKLDGSFERNVCHSGAYQYPSGCPKHREADLREAEEQFRKDEAQWNPRARDSRSKPDRAETPQSGSVHESGGAQSAIAQRPSE